jgi:hypothetical protein
MGVEFFPAKLGSRSASVRVDGRSLGVQELCKEIQLLSTAVRRAGAIVSEVRRNAREALVKTQSADEFVKPLQDALNAQRQAVSALEVHRQKHHC